MIPFSPSLPASPPARSLIRLCHLLAHTSTQRSFSLGAWLQRIPAVPFSLLPLSLEFVPMIIIDSS